jgi:hypothetical protein
MEPISDSALRLALVPAAVLSSLLGVFILDFELEPSWNPNGSCAGSTVCKFECESFSAAADVFVLVKDPFELPRLLDELLVSNAEKLESWFCELDLG